MADWLLQKYIGLLSTRLRNFKRKGPVLYNFSCPLCGDSEHHKNKARAYIYEKEGKMMFHCHNCSKTMHSYNFLRHMDQMLYDQYVMEKMQNEKTPNQRKLEDFTSKMKTPVFMKSGPLKGLKKVSQLPVTNFIKQFVDRRKLPTPFHAKLFSCPGFKHFVNTLIPGKFSQENVEKEETRLLIPYLNRDKEVFAFNARAVNDNPVRYIKIVLDENYPVIFGMDAVDYTKPVYVFEGEFDSMFIPNSLATGGGDLLSAVSPLNRKDNIVIVYDNEPRSKETVKKLDRTILNGYSVVIWPENLEQKDVNDMILSGLSPEFITHILKENTHKDLGAKLALANWSKL